MARPKKTDAPDLADRLNLTAGAIERLTCPDGKEQAFMRDSEAPGLRVRVTAAGAKSFVYEAKLNRQTIRRTIGDVKLWSIEQARTEARRLAVVLDGGQDPREIERQQQADKAAAKAAATADAITVGEAWGRYLEQRRPHWGERSYIDHVKMAAPGGVQRERLPGVKTVMGPLHPLMGLPLRELTASAIEAWAAREAPSRPARVRLALRLLKAFLRWAASEADLKGKADPTAAGTKKAREVAGKPTAKNDYLQREQLAVWFQYVRQIQNPVIAAYLQCLLLVGSRREELAELKWADVNFQWRGMELKDKNRRPPRRTPDALRGAPAGHAATPQ